MIKNIVESGKLDRAIIFKTALIKEQHYHAYMHGEASGWVLSKRPQHIIKHKLKCNTLGLHVTKHHWVKSYSAYSLIL